LGKVFLVLVFWTKKNLATLFQTGANAKAAKEMQPTLKI
jgi:hypothetical protein